MEQGNKQKNFDTRVYKSKHGYCLTRLTLGLKACFYIEGEELERPDLEKYIEITCEKLNKFAALANLIYNVKLQCNKAITCERNSDGELIIYYTVPDTNSRLAYVHATGKHPHEFLDMLLDKMQLSVPLMLKRLLRGRFNKLCYIQLAKMGNSYAQEMLDKHYYKDVFVFNTHGRKEIDINFND